jgi:hypothetical protein
MQSTTTKRAVVIAGCTNLGMNEEQPTQGGEFSCATKQQRQRYRFPGRRDGLAV